MDRRHFIGAGAAAAAAAALAVRPGFAADAYPSHAITFINPFPPGGAADVVARPLVAVLEPFARNGVTMSRVESRPSRAGLWEYLFFVDVAGHAEDAAVAKALADVRAIAPYVKLLGSYPANPL